MRGATEQDETRWRYDAVSRPSVAVARESVPPDSQNTQTIGRERISQSARHTPRCVGADRIAFFAATHVGFSSAAPGMVIPAILDPADAWQALALKATQQVLPHYPPHRAKMGRC
jgi:hypothetical protein